MDKKLGYSRKIVYNDRMRKIFLSMFLSFFVFLGIIHIYINLFWSQKVFLHNVSRKISQHFSLDVSIGKLHFSLLKGIQLANISINGTDAFTKTRLHIETIHTTHKTLWQMLLHRQSLELTITKPHLLFNQSFQETVTQKNFSLKKRYVWMQGLQTFLAPINRHFENFLHTIFSRLSKHWDIIYFKMEQGHIETHFLFDQLPSFAQTISNTYWSQVKGDLILDLRYKHKLKAQLKAVHKDAPVAFEISNTIKNPWHTQIHYVGNKLNFKIDSVLQNSLLNIKSLIGSYQQLKFYSRGSVNIDNNKADLSNIININIENIPFKIPKYLKRLKTKGSIDIFFSFQGNVFKTNDATISGSLSSTSLQIDQIFLTHISSDFQYQHKLLSIDPIAFYLNEEKVIALGDVDLIEPFKPLYFQIRSSDISIKNLGSLVDLYTADLPQIPLRANVRLDISAKLPLEKHHNYTIMGKIQGNNVQFKDNATLWKTFENKSKIPLRHLQPNHFYLQFDGNSNRLKINKLTVNHKDILILSEGTLEPNQNIMFRLATFEKQDQKVNTNQRQLFQLQGTVNRSQITSIQPQIPVI